MFKCHHISAISHNNSASRFHSLSATVTSMSLNSLSELHVTDRELKDADIIVAGSARKLVALFLRKMADAGLIKLNEPIL